MEKKSRKRPNEDTNKKQNNKKSKVSGHWAMGLLSAMDDEALCIKSDDLVTVIKDKYPKARFHYLVLPKQDISNLKALKKEHVPLLAHMEKVAKKLTNDEKHQGSEFKMGYHAEASMLRLHLHVISQDFDSPCLKTKKHWNTFNTDFFLDAKAIRQDLEENGKVTTPSKEKLKEWMDTALKCHKCQYKPKHLPDLKHHVLTHIK